MNVAQIITSHKFLEIQSLSKSRKNLITIPPIATYLDIILSGKNLTQHVYQILTIAV